MSQAVAVVGANAATDGVVETLSDYDPSGNAASADLPEITVERPDGPAFEDVALGVVAGRVGDEAFERANEAARGADVPWIAVELGGLGGVPVTAAGVTVFDPAGACFDCLAARVESNLAPDTEPVAAPGPATQRVAGALAADAAVDFIDDGGDAVLGRVLEVPHAERELLPVPHCDCGGSRDLRVRRDYADVGVEEALARGERALDDRVGIVQQVGEASSFPAPYYLATLADTSAFSDATATRQAAGVATDWNAAFVKALGESCERYAAGVYANADARTAPAADLDAVVPPTAFVTDDPPAWDETTETEWVPATNLATGEETNVPAELAFYPPRRESIRPALTTGLGLGTSPDGALRSGLSEVVERDATMIAWYSSYEPLGLSVDDEAYETLARRARAEGLSVTTLLLTQDVDVPVVAAAVHREDWPRFAVGSAADLDPNRAARGALEEAVQNWVELREMGRDGADDAGGAIGAYAELPDAARDFVDVDQTVPAASVGPDDLPSEADRLDALVERVTDAGMTPYATRTTTRDLAQIGYETVRVLVPEAQPLFLGDAFFGERARRVPGELGFEPRLDGPHHPFP